MRGSGCRDVEDRHAVLGIHGCSCHVRAFAVAEDYPARWPAETAVLQTMRAVQIAWRDVRAM